MIRETPTIEELKQAAIDGAAYRLGLLSQDAVTLVQIILNSKDDRSTAKIKAAKKIEANVTKIQKALSNEQQDCELKERTHND